MEIVPIRLLAKGHFLVDRFRGPVWPVDSEDERLRLVEALSCFGASVKETEAQEGGVYRLSGEIVIGLGNEVECLARQYAHLTRRHFRQVENLEQLKRHRRPSVVVTLTHCVTTELLTFLYPLAERLNSATGIVFAENLSDLKSQVLLKSAIGSICPQGDFKQIDIISDLPIGTLRSQFWDVLGKRSSSHELRSALGAKNSLLTLSAHSDGVDAKLSKNAVLCPLPSKTFNSTKYGNPRCIITGTCHRLDISLERAFVSEHLVSPKEIKTRVLILNSCLGLMSKSGNVNPKWSLVSELAKSSSIGAIIATFELVISGHAAASSLTFQLTRGNRVGEVIANQNRRSSQLKGLRFCLIGDPRTLAVAPGHRIVSPPFNSQELRHPRPICVRDVRELGLIRAILSIVPLDKKRRYLKTARLAVERYERSYWIMHEYRKEASSIGNMMRKAVIRYFQDFGFSYWMEQWMKLASSSKQLQECSCKQCGHETNSLLFRLRVGCVRHLSRCPNCGSIDDFPDRWPLNIRLVRNQKIIEVEGDLPKSGWSAGVRFSSGISRDQVCVNWPNDSIGLMSRRIPIPESLMPGPLFATVIILHQCSIALATRLIRGEEEQRVSP